MKKINRIFYHNSGFSLVEILVALAIIALFVTVSVPLFSGSVERIMWAGEESEEAYKVQEDMDRSIVSGGGIRIPGTVVIEFNGGSITPGSIDVEKITVTGPGIVLDFFRPIPQV